MTHYTLRESGDGGFEIVEVQPVVVATFAGREMAERVLAMLKADGTPSERAAHVHSPEPVAPAPTPETGAGEGWSVAPSAEPAPATEARDEAEDEADWAEMFTEIREGAAFREVAARHGVSVSQLRGKWGAERKRQIAEDGRTGRPPVRQVVRPWTDEDDLTLLERRREGKDWVTIAEELGRTQGACQQRFYAIQKDVARSMEAE
ncbi:MAG: SANT/Myb-like DNA-binding domain-containing protein [Pseudomonadota bacterium]